LRDPSEVLASEAYSKSFLEGVKIGFMPMDPIERVGVLAGEKPYYGTATHLGTKSSARKEEVETSKEDKEESAKEKETEYARLYGTAYGYSAPDSKVKLRDPSEVLSEAVEKKKSETTKAWWEKIGESFTKHSEVKLAEAEWVREQTGRVLEKIAPPDDDRPRAVKPPELGGVAAAGISIPEPTDEQVESFIEKIGPWFTTYQDTTPSTLAQAEAIEDTATKAWEAVAGVIEQAGSFLEKIYSEPAVIRSQTSWATGLPYMGEMGIPPLVGQEPPPAIATKGPDIANYKVKTEEGVEGYNLWKYVIADLAADVKKGDTFKSLETLGFETEDIDKSYDMGSPIYEMGHNKFWEVMDANTRREILSRAGIENIPVRSDRPDWEVIDSFVRNLSAGDLASVYETTALESGDIPGLDLALWLKGLTKPLAEKELGTAIWDAVENQPVMNTRADFWWDPTYKEIKNRLATNPNDEETKQEYNAYMANWKHAAVQAGELLLLPFVPQIWRGIGTAGTALTPTWLAPIRIIRSVPRIATTLAQITITGVPIVYTAAGVVEGFRAQDLDRKQYILESKTVGERNFWAKKVGIDKPYDSLSDEEKALVLVNYAVPPGYTLQDWQELIGSNLELMHETLQKGSAYMFDNTPGWANFIVAPTSVAMGVIGGVVEGAAYMSMLPVITAQMVDKAIEGDAEEYALAVAAGMADFFTKVLPEAFRTDASLATGRVVGLFFFTPKALYKFSRGLGYKIDPRNIASYRRAISIEFSTERIYIPKDFKVTRAEVMEFGNEMIKQLVKGEGEYAVGQIGPYTVKARHVVFQKVIGDTYFHFTPDIGDFKLGESVWIGKTKTTPAQIFGSPHGAERFAEYAAIKGTPKVRPGLIEIHVSPEFNPKLTKLLSKGKQIELEAVWKNEWLDPMPGNAGKGRYLASDGSIYPVQRYVVRGEGVNWTGISAKQKLQIETLAAREAALDAVLGWYGRKQALKEFVKGDPRIKSIKEGIRSLRSEIPESVTLEGVLEHIRTPVQHPVKGGWERTRITVFPITEGGGVVLTRARASHHPKGVWESNGGGLHFLWEGVPRGGMGVESLQPKGLSRTYGRSFESNALQCIKEELGLLANKSDLTYVDMYLGKATEYALSGTRVYTAKVGSQVPDFWRYEQEGVRRAAKAKEVELEAYTIWNGKSEITVTPATYDMLRGVAAAHPELKLQLSKVKTYDSGVEWMKYRDELFGERVRDGTLISEAELRAINRGEINYLRWILQKTMNRPSSFTEYIMAEPNYRLLRDLILGRRRSVTVTRGGSVTPAELSRIVRKGPELLGPEGRKLGGDPTKPLTPDELAKVTKEIETNFEAQLNKMRDLYDTVGDYAYRDSPSIYSENYLGYIHNITRAYQAYGEDYPNRFELIPGPEALSILEAREEALEVREKALSIYPLGYKESYSIYPEGYQAPRLGSYREEETPVTEPRISLYEEGYTPYKIPKPSPDYGPPPPRVPPPDTPPPETIPERPPRYPPRIPPPEMPPPERPSVFKQKGREIELKREQLEQAVTWRQGLVWITVLPPYTEDDVYISDAPPPFVYRAEKGSPKETVSELKMGIEPPKVEFMVPWGIYNIEYDHGRLIYHASGVKKKKHVKAEVEEPKHVRGEEWDKLAKRLSETSPGKKEVVLNNLPKKAKEEMVRDLEEIEDTSPAPLPDFGTIRNPGEEGRLRVPTLSPPRLSMPRL